MASPFEVALRSEGSRSLLLRESKDCDLLDYDGGIVIEHGFFDSRARQLWIAGKLTFVNKFGHAALKYISEIAIRVCGDGGVHTREERSHSHYHRGVEVRHPTIDLCD